MPLVPKQETGNHYDTLHTVICADKLDAKQKYLSACKKLFEINEWSKIGNTILQTDFCLCNREGKEVARNPKTGDHIRINLAGPGSQSGEGYDWVQIEEVLIESENDFAFSSIKVRPAACPLNETKDVAHFFDDAATSTFIVSLQKNKVSAEIHGRNEEPNKNTNYLSDNIRNSVVAKLAVIKLSDIQWKSLCEGFLT